MNSLNSNSTRPIVVQTTVAVNLANALRELDPNTEADPERLLSLQALQRNALWTIADETIIKTGDGLHGIDVLTTNDVGLTCRIILTVDDRPKPLDLGGHQFDDPTLKLGLWVSACRFCGARRSWVEREDGRFVPCQRSPQTTPPAEQDTHDA
jgi:hypothetical protein